ncbi:MAG: alpha-amylase family protein [Pseudomonadota bacterium]
MNGKPIVYQMFTRLFGNQNATNAPWGTIEQNGVGKFSDINDAALRSIRELGVTHIWYTGIPHHAVIRDYTEFGISNDDPDVVKGRAGSPYAVKDYYNVNPDLAGDPARRLEEFDALVERTHAHGMKVIIDIVPNHVARRYESLSAPDGVDDFGVNDDTSVEYARDNNFYYVVGQDFEVPESRDGYQPLGGEPHPLADGKFDESPAKWTGNGARSAQPRHDDWYETVKVNYGVRPDGSHDFPSLPAELRGASCEAHLKFWADKSLPDSWGKFRDIGLYWLDRGVDGFRFDMAELVPVEFWSYMNCSLKAANPDAFLLAEVYDPSRYRDYIQLGKMDYLYDKVGFYDTLRPAMSQNAGTDGLVDVHAAVADIADHMLHFLENHDEQRIASDAFAGEPAPGVPGMAISALISRAPTLLYFGQELGEPGAENLGFGDPTRTTIFDYAGVPTIQAWMNGGAFDGGQLTVVQRDLRERYARILKIAAAHPAMQGRYADIHVHNRQTTENYTDRLFSFIRWTSDKALVVVTSLEPESTHQLTLSIPASALSLPPLATGEHTVSDLLSNAAQILGSDGQRWTLPIEIEPNSAQIWEISLSAD